MNLQKLLLTKNDAYTEARKIIPFLGIYLQERCAGNLSVQNHIGFKGSRQAHTLLLTF